MSNVKKVVVANYSEDVLQAIIAEYRAFIVDFPQDNAAILHTLATKYGKTVHSLRAKLSSLKVYKTAQQATQGTVGINKATKEQIVDTLCRVCQLNLEGLEVAPKRVLQDLLTFIVRQAKRIDELEASE